MKIKSKTTAITSVAIVLAIVLSLSATAFAASSYISSDRAQEIAYSDAGITSSQVVSVDTLTRYRSGSNYYYKLVFRTSSTKYVYKINASSEAIVLSNTYTINGGSGSTGGSNGGSAASIITSEEALAIALKHAGVAKSDLTKKEIELERDDGVRHYDVEFKTSDGTKYEYEIGAEKGEILKHSSKKTKAAGGTGTITSEEALSIAMKHAGISKSDIEEQEIELKSKKSASYYEIEFELYNDSEYEYKIDASTGAILDYEYDRD